ncbi:MAG: response regulator [Candidatus Chloroheliales bacterium]|nr:MAG: response regulator [Chloroflexota bacterium]
MTQRILAMNDNLEILQLYQELLSDEGYEVILQSVALRDLDIIRDIAPDLIILDYIINGDIVGWRILQMLKMSNDLATIPVIICTGATQKVKEMEGHLTAKGVAIVLKPFDIYELIEKVNYALNGSGVKQTASSTSPTKSDIDR